MSVQFRRKIFFTAIFLSTHSVNASSQTPTNCEKSGLCTLPSLKIEFTCPKESTQLFKYNVHSDELILGCLCECSSQENHFAIYSRTNNIITLEKSIDASRIISADSFKIAKESGVPEPFSTVAICTSDGDNLINDAGSLVVLTKIPSLDNASPYCYEAKELSSTIDSKDKELNFPITLKIDKNEKITPTLLRFIETSLSNNRNNREWIRSAKTPQAIYTIISNTPTQASTIETLNNIAFYWQQADMHENAIKLLHKVLQADPKRTVAYLNIADSYWSVHNLELATRNYAKYVDLMKKAGKEKTIPARATARLRH